MNHWIDSHAHLSFLNAQQVDSVVAQGFKNNLKLWLLAGYDSDDWQKQKELLLTHSQFVKTCLGLHPWKVAELSEAAIGEELTLLEQMLPLAQAMGETGIDKYKKPDSVPLQQEVFVRHLEMNKKFNLPLVLHSVRADQEVLHHLKCYSFTGIVHRFSGSYEVAQSYLNLGFKISLGRDLLSPGHHKLKECVKKLNIDDFVIESDAGLNRQGEVEDAVDLFFKVVEQVSELKKIPIEHLMESCFLNTKKVFRL